MNFVVEEPGTAYYVRVAGTEGPPLVVYSRDGCVQIPPRPWRSLLAQNRGKPLSVETYVRDHDHGWQRFEAFPWNIA